jgi:hypothetical protein
MTEFMRLTGYTNWSLMAEFKSKGYEGLTEFIDGVVSLAYQMVNEPSTNKYTIDYGALPEEAVQVFKIAEKAIERPENIDMTSATFDGVRDIMHQGIELIIEAFDKKYPNVEK